MDLPLTAFGPERTATTDEVYAAIGRLLTLATRFEAHCKSLATLAGVMAEADVADVIASGGDELDVLFKKIAGGKLFAYIKKIQERTGLPDDYAGVLHQARNARNDTAHSLTIAFEDSVDPCDPAVMKSIREYATLLARADFYVAVMLDMFNEVPPVGSFLIVLNEYIDRLVAWVCMLNEDS